MAKNTPETNKKKLVEESTKKKTATKVAQAIQNTSKTQEETTAQITTTIVQQPLLPHEEFLLEEKPIEIAYVQDTEHTQIATMPPIAPTKEMKKKQISTPKTTTPKSPTDSAFTTTSDERHQIEAILFSSGKALSETTIAELCGIDKKKTKKLLEELQKEYETRNTSLRVFNDNDLWRINVKEKYVSAARKIVSDTELAKSIMETLAVVAWKTPINQSEVVRIRGNKCYDHIAELEQLAFITKTKKGRSFILKTTDKFYDYFDMDHGQMKEILDEIKNPANATVTDAQMTLNGTLNGLDVVSLKNNHEHTEQNPKTAEIFNHKEQLLGQLEVIQVKRKEENPEQEEEHKAFLERMDQKLSQIAKNTDEVILREKKINAMFENDETKTDAEQQENTIETNTEQQEDAFELTSAQSITLTDQDVSNQEIPHQETIKPKKLTKKQLEKKFKEDILKKRAQMNNG